MRGPIFGVNYYFVKLILFWKATVYDVMIKREQLYFVAETSFYASVSNAPHGAVSRSHFPPVINPRGGDVGMPQELLDLGDINLVLQRICRGGRPEGVRGHPPGQRDVCFLGVFADNSPDGIGRQSLFQNPGAVVPQWPEQGTLRVVAVTGRVQVVEEGLDGCRVNRDVTDS